MKGKGRKINSILDDREDSGLFSQGSSSRIEAETTENRVKSSKKIEKKRTGKKIIKRRVTKKVNGKRISGKQSQSKAEPSLTKVAKALQSVSATDIEVGPDLDQEQDAESDLEPQVQASAPVLDPNTISIVTVNEKISRKLAYHLWQQLPAEVLQSLKDLILNVYIEPVVLQTSRSDKVRDRLRDLIEELIKELIKKLQVVKLPPIKNKSFLNLETLLNKKLYLESVLSSNLKQIDILEKELVKFEKIYNRDLVYFNNLSKAIQNDDLVKDIKPEENLEHQILNLKKLEKTDGEEDPDFDKILGNLERHLSMIDNNIKDLTQLNEKVELVHDLFQFLQ